MVDPVITDTIRIVVGAGVLSFAAVADLRWRRAPDLCWVLVALVGAALLATEALTTPAYWSTNMPALVTSGLVLVLAIGGYYTGLIAGGADAKALASLSLLAPLPLSAGWSQPLGSILPLVVTVLMNGLLVALAVPVLLTVWNLARRDIDSWRTVLGFRTRIDRVDLRVVWPLEYVDEEGEHHRAYTPGGVPLDAYEPKRLLEQGVERVWVTPKIPFLVPLSIGFAGAVLLGDPFATLLETVLV